MAYRNQNYMTNLALKEQADKAQKDYVDPNQEPEEVFTPIRYSFTSYTDAEGTTSWATGIIETTGVTEDNLIQIEIKTSDKQADIGTKFYIASDAEVGETVYPAYSTAESSTASIYMKITHVEYSFTAYEDSEGQTQSITGTFETTGVSNNGFIELKVKTSSEQDYVDEKYYISVEATPGETIYPLYSDAGTTSVMYVAISQ